jgi:hypothetical protein
MKRTKHEGVLATLTAHRRHLVAAITMALVATAFTLGAAPAATAAAPPGPYFNGFENAGDAITGMTARHTSDVRRDSCPLRYERHQLINGKLLHSGG